MKRKGDSEAPLICGGLFGDENAEGECCAKLPAWNAW